MWDWNQIEQKYVLLHNEMARSEKIVPFRRRAGACDGVRV